MDDKTNATDHGGATWFVEGNTLIREKFRRDLKDLNARGKGMEVGRNMPPNGDLPIPNDTELDLTRLADANSTALSGHAYKAYLKARETIQTRPPELNAEVRRAQAETELGALELAISEKAKPVALEVHQTQGELNHYRATHRRGPLADNAYAIDATIAKPLLASAIAGSGDAVFNGVQFIPVMPGGLLQALVISGAMSAAMAVTGAMAGTALRYLFYAEASLRRLWRFVGGAALVAAAMAAGTFAQYRAVLEAAAVTGDEPHLSSVFTTSPTIMSVTVIIGAAIVFAFAAMKFRGGPDSPWARYGDHAHYDRDARLAKEELGEIKKFYFDNIRAIGAEAVSGFQEVHEADRIMLRTAYAARDAVKLQIRDQRRSADGYWKEMIGEILQFRAGVMAVRPAVRPEQFPRLPEQEVTDFPDPSELDKAIKETQATFTRRTEQLAELERDIGRMELAAMERFPVLIEQVLQAGEDQRRRDHSVHRLITEPEGAAS